MIVVVAEKPSVGRDLARILGATRRESGYLEGGGYCVTWAFGHLVELEEPDKYDPTFKKWSMSSLPILPDPFRLKVSSGKGVKEQFNVIKKLFKSADSIICATDAGREGELIFRYLLKICRAESKPAQRLWISSLTDQAIREGFRQLRPLSDYDPLAAAATCRSQADWIVGLNATRGYTLQHSHGRGVFSVGRVQSPLLALIVKREQTIRNFKPEDYWELWTLYRNVKFKHVTDRFKKRGEAEQLFQKVEGEELQIVKIEEKATSQPPPQLFDLTELQRTLNRLSGFSADYTLKVAQGLYEKKLLSYPRTDSRYLSDDLYSQCGEVLQKLHGICGEKLHTLDLKQLPKSRRVFNNSKVTDHHAIIPTGQVSCNLSREEEVVFRAVLTRFIAVFYPNCERANTTVHGEVVQESFKAKGTRIVKAGWLVLYQTEEQVKKGEEQPLPSFVQGERGEHLPEVKQCQTKPPLHYTEATLLTAMETAGKEVEEEELREAMKERGLGTPATRAATIETLMNREYIRKEKKNLFATDKGEELIQLLQNQATLTSAEMTGQWEHQLKMIERGEGSSEQFMLGIKAFTSDLIDQLKNGKAPLGNCPLCSQPVIKGREGFGCSAWKRGCPFRFHSHQFGTVLKEQDVQALLYRGRLNRPRKLIDQSGAECQGYITLDFGKIGMITREAKVEADAIGRCPLCTGSVVEKYKSYSCTSCEFVIWKSIARRKISKTLAQVLLSKGKSQQLKGFRSKAGKLFSASLVLQNGKVNFDFTS